MRACYKPGCDNQIADTDRAITITAHVNWGDNDARADWSGERTFCSFACAGEYLAALADKHDGRVVPA